MTSSTVVLPARILRTRSSRSMGRRPGRGTAVGSGLKISSLPALSPARRGGRFVLRAMVDHCTLESMSMIEPAGEPKDRFHMTNVETETALRRFLLSRGFSLSDELTQNGATGPDIVATPPNGDAYFIEVIGYKKSAPARSRDFYEGLIRALARLSLGARRVVLACPYTFQDGLGQRVRYLDNAWLRIGHAFPELELWFVYTHGTSLSYASWNYWGRQTLDPPRIIDCSKRYPCRFGAPVSHSANEFHECYNRYHGSPPAAG